MIATRMIGASDRSETTLVWSAGVGLIVLTVLLPFGFRTPTLGELGIGICIGICASTGQYLLILAYRRATASVLAPFSYIQLLSSALMGYLVFGAVPDALAFVGGGVIIASGLYIVHRERVRARQA
jgi:drug/metabolite transporter (DMT)-like permease